MENEFLKNLSQHQSDVNREIKIFFDKEIKEAKPPFLAKTLKNLKEFSLRPGKRVRAILVMQGYFLSGGKNKREILKTSVFIELIHNFLLIHDDILDRAESRRGKPSLHKFYQGKESEHYGTSMAVVAGDMMEFLARKILAIAKFPDKLKVDVEKKLNQILIETAYGEMFEFWLRKKFEDKKTTIKEEDILDIYRTKTAFYTFVGPLQMGAMLAGVNKKTTKFLEEIGVLLGTAFQINDDLEDILLQDASDIKEGQPSLLLLRALKKQPGLRRYFGLERLSKKDLKIIKNLVQKSGAYNECLLLANRLAAEAKDKILRSKCPRQQKKFLMNLADFIVRQNKL